MKMLRAEYIVFLVFFMGIKAHSQLKFPVTNNGLRHDLTTVIADFPNNFSTIKGDVLVENPQSVEYASLLDFSGAEGNSITKYNSTKSIYSWKALMLTTEDFTEATKKYKWLYNQLKVMTIQLNDYSFSLAGDYDEPDETKKFSACTFRLLPAATNLPKLKIEVTMEFEFPEWKTSIVVFEKEREDEDRGNIKEDFPTP
ncbi:MAG TPA: hypothetical protein VGO09_02475 [Flavisolibacter sp.]|nr:hypothetical protein [Flavisolibacter sp.]